MTRCGDGGAAAGDSGGGDGLLRLCKGSGSSSSPSQPGDGDACQTPHSAVASADAQRRARPARTHDVDVEVAAEVLVGLLAARHAQVVRVVDVRGPVVQRQGRLAGGPGLALPHGRRYLQKPHQGLEAVHVLRLQKQQQKLNSEKHWNYGTEGPAAAPAARTRTGTPPAKATHAVPVPPRSAARRVAYPKTHGAPLPISSTARSTPSSRRACRKKGLGGSEKCTTSFVAVLAASLAGHWWHTRARR